ncbi:MAG: tetratricopeptide repeat protein [Cellvibrionaceae bacterium]
MAFVELIKRSEFEKIKSFWGVELALSHARDYVYKSEKAILDLPYQKISMKKMLTESGVKICSKSKEDWFYVGASNGPGGVRSIFFRMFNDAVPVWCRFDFKKDVDGFRLIAVENMNLNYSTYDFFYEVSSLGRGSVLGRGINRFDKKSKLLIFNKITSSNNSKEQEIAKLKEHQVKDLGLVYINWLIGKKRFLDAMVVAENISKRINDSYFDSYVKFWITSEKGDYKQAIAHLYQGLQYAPTDTLLFYFIFEMAVAGENYDLAVSALETLLNSLDFKMKDLDVANLKGGVQFLNSSSYALWEKSR